MGVGFVVKITLPVKTLRSWRGVVFLLMGEIYKMLKVIGSFFGGVIVAALLVYNIAGSLMFKEVVSPFGVEETVARIQQNIQNAGNGWSLSGLRNAAKPIEADGGNVLPVLMIEACSTKYSGPILKDDSIRFLSNLMPCKISVYKKNDGKTYIGMMNAKLIGSLFGSMVGEIMGHVAADQAKFIVFDASKPAPAMIKGMPGAASGGSGTGAAGGC
jgi:uncharacterized protein (DUF302 family)